MTKNPEEMLNKGIMTNHFLQNHKSLNLTESFKLTEIKRAMALSPDTYILLYKIDDCGKVKFIRGNSSTTKSRMKSYEVMKILQQNGFSEDGFRSPNYFAFDTDHNLLLYSNIEGEILINKIKEKNITKEIKLCAHWLGKLHKLDYPINIPKYNFDINSKDLERFYPDLSKKMEATKEENLTKIKHDRRMLIHGDYQPNNIIINNGEIWVFDFNDASCDNPMIDVASFLSQLRAMLLRFADVKAFDNLSKVFLLEYEKTNAINVKMRNDLGIYQKLFYLKILASLSASLNDKDPRKKEILSKIYQWYNET